jgi:hypothetical protein
MPYSSSPQLQNSKRPSTMTTPKTPLFGLRTNRTFDVFQKMEIDDIVKKINDPSGKEYQITNRHDKVGGGHRYTIGPTLEDRKLQPFTSVLLQIIDGRDIAFVRKPVIDITAPSTPLTPIK